FEALQNEYQVKLNELREFEATGLRELDELAAAQARETYERIVRAGVRVAQDRGYTHLVISRGNAPISERADNLNAVTQEILARLILIAPEGDNLTAAVRVDLGLPPTRDEEELEVQLDLTPGAPGGGG
ncbi:MAG: OmpH family outer membrane protein, partial [Planctomycetota bacterium]